MELIFYEFQQKIYNNILSTLLRQDFTIPSQVNVRPYEDTRSFSFKAKNPETIRVTHIYHYAGLMVCVCVT